MERKLPLSVGSQLSRYNRAFNYAIATLTLEGDLIPMNEREYLFNFIFVLLGLVCTDRLEIKLIRDDINYIYYINQA